MTSSQQTYDLFADHVPADRLAAEEFGRHLRAAGLRPWLVEWSAVPHASLDAEQEFAVSASRLVARVIGRSGLSPWSKEDGGHKPPARETGKPAIVVLAPGCPVAPHQVPPDLSDNGVVDLRRGFDADRALRTLRRFVSGSAASDRTCVDPDRRLDPAALKRSVVESYDGIAEKFAARWVDHPPLGPLEKFLDLLPHQAVILDAGCGPGHHASFLAERGHDVVGVDLSEGMLRIARRRDAAIRFARMDVQALEFPPATFDAIWCAGTAMHVPREEVVSLFRGFRRVVRPAGVVGINMQIARRSEVVNYDADRRFFEYYRSGDEIAGLARRAGLVVVAADYGETTRNTHDLDLTLKWVTLYTVPAGVSSAA